MDRPNVWLSIVFGMVMFRAISDMVWNYPTWPLWELWVRCGIMALSGWIFLFGMGVRIMLRVYAILEHESKCNRS